MMLLGGIGMDADKKWGIMFLVLLGACLAAIAGLTALVDPFFIQKQKGSQPLKRPRKPFQYPLGKPGKHGAYPMAGSPQHKRPIGPMQCCSIQYRFILTSAGIVIWLWGLGG